jgi:D-glycero-D-manno-heptose 1,7-bisphosphate phosphatase|tara:strand:+ start:72 stop:599 length:528 start_codon:yes stop_codon:yes gene_type:complete
MSRAVFFDRDGVLNELVNRDGGFFSPLTLEDFHLFPDTRDVINEIRSKGYLCITVSNQPDVARGYLKRSELNRMTQILSSTLHLDDVFYCLHDDSDDCDCRKPKPGLLFQAQKKWDIDLCESIMIGDTWKDVEAARNASVRMVLFEAKYNLHLEAENKITDLFQIGKFLINDLDY